MKVNMTRKETFPLPLNEASTPPLSLSTYSFDENMSDMLDIWQILNTLKKWWWLILSFSTLVVALVALVVFRMTPVYMATSVLEIKQKEHQIFSTSDVESYVVDKEFFNTQVELLKSKSLAENVIDSLNLISDIDFAGIEADTREVKGNLVIQAFSKKLKISPVGRSRLINVSFEHTNPAAAAHISNAVADMFISLNLERKYNATSYARDFIEGRLKITKDILEKSERDLVKYSSDNELVTLRDYQGNVTPGFLNTSALIKLDLDLTNARTNRVESEQKYQQTLVNPSMSEILKSQTILELKTHRINLNSSYMEKLAIYKPDFPDMLELKSRIDFMTDQINQETENIKNTTLSELKVQYEIALAGENDLQKRVDSLKKSVIDIRDKSIDYNILNREVETNRTQYDALLQRLKEVSVSDEIGSNLISLVDHAKQPVRPFKPNKLRSLLLAAIFGATLGLGLVFAYEIIDDRIKTPDDVKKKLKSTIMGIIPKSQPNQMQELLSDPQSGIAEAYASLRTNLQFSGPNGGPKIIHVTSTQNGEGKSITALGLALRFAGLQEKVLLLDADIRLPTFTGITDGESIGLSGLLTSSENPAKHIQHTKYENLDLLPSGNSVPNSSEILSTYRMDEILNYVREHYDHVIVDSPPVMGLADAPLLSSKCDASLLVVEFASIRTPAIKVTLERLNAAGSKVLGIVMTKYKAPSKGYLNYYQYSYGDDAQSYNGENVKGRKSKLARNKMHIDITSS